MWKFKNENYATNVYSQKLSGMDNKLTARKRWTVNYKEKIIIQTHMLENKLLKTHCM